jgi:glycosyltransferase involved in cell wall biosynthesis
MGESMTQVSVEFASDNPGLRGRSIDICELVPGSSGREIEIAGWTVGEERGVAAVEVLAGADAIGRFAVDQPRPDVHDAFPDIDRSACSGFQGRLGLLEFPPAGIQLVAVLDDQTRVPFAMIASSMVPSAPESGAGAPLVSVIIPCYRQAHFLVDSVVSVLRQDHPHVEIVVVDDGSPDNTEAVIRRWPGIRYLRQDNGGLAAARNAGFRESRGGFVLFLDADDRLLPSAISTGLRHFRDDPSLGMVAGHFRTIGLDGRVIASPEPRTTSRDHYVALLRDYFIGPPGVMLFRKEAFAALGGFDVHNSPAADYELALHAARTMPIRVHDEVVFEYRRHGANMTGNPTDMLTSTMAVLRRQRDHARNVAGGRAAYRAGIRHWRAAWGEPLVTQTVANLQARRFGDAGSELVTLARYYPRGLVRVAHRIVRASFASRSRAAGFQWSRS